MLRRLSSATLAVMLLAGCEGFKYLPSDASGQLEALLITETDRASDALRASRVIEFRVRGEITETITAAQKLDMPVAWYYGGVAWYYRPQIHKYVSVDKEPGKVPAKDIAAHEVYHAQYFFHDAGHWKCMSGIATPTYPHPGTGHAAQAFCFHNAEATLPNTF